MSWNPKQLAMDMAMRAITGLIAGLLAAWVTLQVMQQEIRDMNRLISAQTVAIDHTNERIDALELNMLTGSNKIHLAPGSLMKQNGDPP